MSEQAEEHGEAESRCLRGNQCEAPEVVDGQTVGGRADRALCRACEDATAAALTAAPRLHAQLRALSTDRGPRSALSDKVTRSRTGSFGLNATPLHLAEGLWWHLTGWADEVISTAGRPTVDRTSQPAHEQVVDACVLLARYLSVWVAHRPVEFQVTRSNADPDDPKAQPTGDTVTAVQAGWEGCAWLIAWRTSAERLLKLPVLVHHPPEPCPQCDQEGGLRREDGADKVWCVWCRKSWTLDTYQVFVHAWMRDTQAPEPECKPGPGSSAEGQDARRGTAAHTIEDVA